MQDITAQTNQGEELKVIKVDISRRTLFFLLGIITILFISNVWLLTERVRYSMKEKYCLDTLQLYYDHFERSKK